MERLTLNDLDSVCYDSWELCGLDHVCQRDCKDCHIPKMIIKLAKFEDLEEQRRLIKLPCKVGDYIHVFAEYQHECLSFGRVDLVMLSQIKSLRVQSIVITSDGICFQTKYKHIYTTMENITFCYTREEAELKLKEIK